MARCAGQGFAVHGRDIGVYRRTRDLLRVRPDRQTLPLATGFAAPWQQGDFTGRSPRLPGSLPVLPCISADDRSRATRMLIGA